jgi:hypothetical protein
MSVRQTILPPPPSLRIAIFAWWSALWARSTALVLWVVDQTYGAVWRRALHARAPELEPPALESSLASLLAFQPPTSLEACRATGQPERAITWPRAEAPTLRIVR